MALSNRERQAAYRNRLKAAAAAGGEGPSLRQLLAAYFAEQPERLEEWQFANATPAEAADQQHRHMLHKVDGNLREALAELEMEGANTPAAVALRSLLTRVLA